MAMLDLFRPAPPKPLTTQPRPRLQRQSKRFSAPVFDLPIRVEVLVGGVRYPGQLWDVSEHGACLLLRSPIAPRQVALIRIQTGSSGETIDVQAQLKWVDAVMGSYYVGVQFAHPIDFGPTFLGALIGNTETFSRIPHRVASA